MSTNSKNILNSLIPSILFTFLGITIYFDPIGAIGLRTPLIIALIPLWVYGYFVATKNIDKDALIFLLSYFTPVYGLLIYILRGDSDFQINDTSYISTAVVLSLVYVFKNRLYQDKFLKITTVIGLLYSFLIIYAGVELTLLQTSNIIDIAVENEMARVSFREYADIKLPYVYFYSSPFLILPLCYLLFRNDDKINWMESYGIVVMIIALFLSGARAHIVLSIAFAIVYGIKSNVIVRVILVLILLYFIFINYIDIVILISSMLSTQEDSNYYKLSMIDNYISIYSDPITLIFGQGYQAIGWSKELVDMTNSEFGATKTELTYFEIIRVYGFIVGGVIMYYVVKSIPAYTHNGFNRYLYICIIVVSLLNPHLFSSYGAVILAISLSTSNKVKISN